MSKNNIGILKDIIKTASYIESDWGESDDIKDDIENAFGSYWGSLAYVDGNRNICFQLLDSDKFVSIVGVKIMGSMFDKSTSPSKKKYIIS